MSQNNIKPSEISDVLLKQLESADLSVKFEEVGTVLQVSDGVARIYGLTNAESGELLEFDSGVMGVVMNLEVDNVGAVLLGPTDEVKEGMTVKRTGRIVSIPVSEKMLGRVVNPLGVPIDGLGEIGGDKVEMPLERKAPGVIFRQPVNEPLQTGIKAIDAMIPIGRGQRELIIGDRHCHRYHHKSENRIRERKSGILYLCGDRSERLYGSEHRKHIAFKGRDGLYRSRGRYCCGSGCFAVLFCICRCCNR